MPTDEFHYQLIRLIESRPDLSQRELARELGVSLGKTNYCIKALIDKGWIKTRNFRNSGNKLAYAYILTPKGIARKWYLTRRFLERKQAEYDLLRSEIDQLSRELESRERRDESASEDPESTQSESVVSIDTR